MIPNNRRSTTNQEDGGKYFNSKLFNKITEHIKKSEVPPKSTSALNSPVLELSAEITEVNRGKEGFLKNYTIPKIKKDEECTKNDSGDQAKREKKNETVADEKIEKKIDTEEKTDENDEKIPKKTVLKVDKFQLKNQNLQPVVCLERIDDQQLFARVNQLKVPISEEIKETPVKVIKKKSVRGRTLKVRSNLDEIAKAKSIAPSKKSLTTSELTKAKKCKVISTTKANDTTDELNGINEGNNLGIVLDQDFRNDTHQEKISSGGSTELGKKRKIEGTIDQGSSVVKTKVKAQNACEIQRNNVPLRASKKKKLASALRRRTLEKQNLQEDFSNNSSSLNFCGQSSPAASFLDQNSPAGFSQQNSSEIVASGQNIPKSISEQTSPGSVSLQNSPEGFSVQNSQNVIFRRKSPVIFSKRNSPVSLPERNFEVVLSEKTSPASLSEGYSPLSPSKRDESIKNNHQGNASEGEITKILSEGNSEVVDKNKNKVYNKVFREKSYYERCKLKPGTLMDLEKPGTCTVLRRKIE